MIKEIGKPLEIAVEKELEFVINGKVYRKFCTPKMLKELAIGFLISEGIARNLEEIKLEILENRIIANVSKDPCIVGRVFLNEKKIQKREGGEKYRVEELRRYLELLDIEEYKKTRGYHVAMIVVGKEFYRAYDVGRHNAVDKAIGLALLNGVDLRNSFLVLSGRISREIVEKCANVGIPLVVSKAAILSSAIEFCQEFGISAISFATNLAIGEFE
ncbi:MAG: formate dehydrogenase accessory sulfurtransferase FdhD [Archaeoglobaceae archaeon]|nr:formate dehydrogenase accessory sulfurtransferase FdhD [Archaeoglobaceae archaeon]MDW8127766.1 formate dehydrogenase accessory sulfurtransferase FdhD [Archaeoglobaceae archaeon]